MRNFTKLPTRQLIRGFSKVRKLELVKFDAKSKGDYELFRKLIIENMEFSALQFLIPNIHDDIEDLKDEEEVGLYFDKFGKDKYLHDAYSFVTQNHDRGPLGYNKVLQDGEFVGNSGWIMHEINEDGLIKKLERGIHLKQRLCSPNLTDKPNTSFKPRLGANIIRKVVQELDENKESLDLDGQIVSSILISNTRSQAFTQKYKLNVGDPIYQENGANKWVQRIGDFTSRIPEILGLLDDSINESKGR